MRIFRMLAVAAVATGLAVAGLLAVAPPGFVSPPFFHNTTPSLPRGFYRVEVRDTLRVGDFVRTCAPEDLAPMALDRGYLSPGSCPGGTTRIGKMVVALPGDSVLVAEHGVTVRKRLIPRSAPQRSDRMGRRVAAALGRHVLAEGHCFVLSTYSVRSWDSRYFGPVRCEPPHFVLRAASRRARLQLDSLRFE